MSKSFWKAAGIRALRTFCQVAAAGIPVGAAFSEIGWVAILDMAAGAAVASLLTSVYTGLPEVEE